TFQEADQENQEMMLLTKRPSPMGKRMFNGMGSSRTLSGLAVKRMHAPSWEMSVLKNWFASKQKKLKKIGGLGLRDDSVK
ncbi:MULTISPECIES: hypothetical protein, partial [unclassified Hyphomonas]|uniref:hypothetical protein n=1 Tax=unclassified Hyphomonas TaxID=2630699 RepID=UPI000E8EEF6B